MSKVDVGLDNYYYRILALGYGGQFEEADALSAELARSMGAGLENSEFGRFYVRTFGAQAKGWD